MESKIVRSSNLNKIGYDKSTKRLEITFNTGAVYSYQNVSERTYKELSEADSPGRYFFQFIKPIYLSRKEK